MSKLTVAPPRRLSKLSEVSTPLWWKKYSFPSSAAMNPNPRSETIFFTVPFGIAVLLLSNTEWNASALFEREECRPHARSPEGRANGCTLAHWSKGGKGPQCYILAGTEYETEERPGRRAVFRRDPLAVFSWPPGLRRHRLDRHPEWVPLPDPAPSGPAHPCPCGHARLEHPRRIRHLPLALRRGGVPTPTIPSKRGRERFASDPGPEPAGGGRHSSLRPSLPEREPGGPCHLRVPGASRHPRTPPLVGDPGRPRSHDRAPSGNARRHRHPGGRFHDRGAYPTGTGEQKRFPAGGCNRRARHGAGRRLPCAARPGDQRVAPQEHAGRP